VAPGWSSTALPRRRWGMWRNTRKRGTCKSTLRVQTVVFVAWCPVTALVAGQIRLQTREVWRSSI
jgi:lambda repressor-like predicted transcriptional regulator